MLDRTTNLFEPPAEEEATLPASAAPAPGLGADAQPGPAAPGVELPPLADVQLRREGRDNQPAGPSAVEGSGEVAHGRVSCSVDRTPSSSLERRAVCDIPATGLAGVGLRHETSARQRPSAAASAVSDRLSGPQKADRPPAALGAMARAAAGAATSPAAVRCGRNTSTERGRRLERATAILALALAVIALLVALDGAAGGSYHTAPAAPRSHLNHRGEPLAAEALPALVRQRRHRRRASPRLPRPHHKPRPPTRRERERVQHTPAAPIAPRSSVTPPSPAGDGRGAPPGGEFDIES